MRKELLIKHNSLKTFSIKARMRSFRFAFEGMIAFFSTQHNAIVHLLMTLLVMIAAVLFRINKAELIAVVLATGFVWAAELFNTAIERLADMVSPGFHPKIKIIKDIAAAAVLVSAVCAFTTGVIIFIPKLFL